SSTSVEFLDTFHRVARILRGSIYPGFPGTERVPLFAKTGNRSLYHRHRKHPRVERYRAGPFARLLNDFWRFVTTNEKADNVFKYLHHSRDTRSARCSA